MSRLTPLFTLSLLFMLVVSVNASTRFCPGLYHNGVMKLDINPAFLSVDQYNSDNNKTADGLTISSFFNFNFNQVAPNATAPIFPPFAADQVGIIKNIANVEPELFDFKMDFQKITDLSWGQPKTVWPNEAIRVPDGVLNFEAVIIPQGFFSQPQPGRLSIINIDDPMKQEYIVHQSTIDPAFPPHSPNNSPKFYHQALFYDMDGDGLKDIITVRGGLRVIGGYPPFSELVYFRNPGIALDPNTPWEEIVLYGGPLAEFMGPDIHLSMHDFENDGVPEIVATHFFTGDTVNPPTKGKIAIYGAPVGGSWAQVNASQFRMPRAAVISDDQGFPFGLEIVDLNGDGKVEILATNHQPNCTAYPTTPGRVYALEQPESGNLFEDTWPVHVLLDNIRPQPSVFGAFRLAPGHAMTFFPTEINNIFDNRPWILVSGDEAGKVWIMKPTYQAFTYETAVIFDINDHYGEGTTQTLTPNGVTISTIGKVAFRYDDIEMPLGMCLPERFRFGVAEIFIPVFEAQEIHVLSFNRGWRQRESCVLKIKPFSAQSDNA